MYNCLTLLFFDVNLFTNKRQWVQSQIPMLDIYRCDIVERKTYRIFTLQNIINFFSHSFFFQYRISAIFTNFYHRQKTPMFKCYGMIHFDAIKKKKPLEKNINNIVFEPIFFLHLTLLQFMDFSHYCEGYFDTRIKVIRSPLKYICK